MSKQDFTKIQTCVLKVNMQCHCEGCKTKIKKLIKKIDGVYNTTIDMEQGKVTVSGNVDPAMLIRKLEKSGKHVELWGGQKGSNNYLHILNDPFKNIAINGGRDDKSQKLIPSFEMSKEVKKVKDKKSIKLQSDKNVSVQNEESGFDPDELYEEKEEEFGGGQGGGGLKGKYLSGKMMSMLGKGRGAQSIDDSNGGGVTVKTSEVFETPLTKKRVASTKINAEKQKDEDVRTKYWFSGFGKKSKNGRQEHVQVTNKSIHLGNEGKEDDNVKEIAKNDEAKSGMIHEINKTKLGIHEIGVHNNTNNPSQDQMSQIAQIGGTIGSNRMPFVPRPPMQPAMQGANIGYSHGDHGYYLGMGNQQAMMMNQQQRPNGNDMMYYPTMYPRQQPQFSYTAGPPPMPAPGMSDQYTYAFSDENANGCSVM